MSGGGSKTTQSATQSGTTTNMIDPQYLAMLQGNYKTAQQNATSLAQPYTGQLTAGFTPTQNQAMGILSNVATDPTYQANNTAASNAVSGVLGTPINGTITPTAASTSTVASNPVTAGLLANTNLSPYENPYQSDVINASVAQNERAREIAQTQANEQATAGNAFGGSRSGVANALTNQLYDQNDQTNIANLNTANFNQAQTAATGDINRQLSADEYNSSGNLAAQQSNQTAGLNTSEFNSAQDTATQQASFNNALASAGLQLNAAGQLVSTNAAALQTATNQGGILSAVGDAQQQQQQTELTNAYNAYLQGNQLTVEQQQLLNSALGLIPNQQTISTDGTSTGTSKTSQSMGLGSILGGAGSAMGGIGSLGSLFGGSGAAAGAGGTELAGGAAALLAA